MIKSKYRSIGRNRRSELAVIDESRPNGKIRRMGERLHLLLNVRNDTVPYLTATLDLNDEKRLARLDQQVNLTLLRPLRRLLPIRPAQ